MHCSRHSEIMLLLFFYGTLFTSSQAAGESAAFPTQVQDTPGSNLFGLQGKHSRSFLHTNSSLKYPEPFHWLVHFLFNPVVRLQMRMTSNVVSYFCISMQSATSMSKSLSALICSIGRQSSSQLFAYEKQDCTPSKKPMKKPVDQPVPSISKTGCKYSLWTGL